MITPELLVTLALRKIRVIAVFAYAYHPLTGQLVSVEIDQVFYALGPHKPGEGFRSIKTALVHIPGATQQFTVPAASLESVRGMYVYNEE